MWTGPTTLPPGKSVCHACRRAQPAPYGARTDADRPYGYEFQRTRAELLPKAYYRPCPICGSTMWPNQKLALDHSIPLHVDPTSKGDRIVHSRCNSAWRSGNDTPPMTPEQRRQKKRDQARKYDAVRGGTTARGYGAAHARERKRWAPIVQNGQVRCARCHQIIEPGTPWHLDHDDRDRSIYLGPSHRSCNIKAAIRRRARSRGQRRAA